MSDYKSGHDPQYGYNKYALAYGTLGTTVMSRVIKLIVSPIGLISEAVHSRKAYSQMLPDIEASETSDAPIQPISDHDHIQIETSVGSRKDQELPTYVEVATY